ncbi:hypothetical protein ABMY26_07210 (plasmid) [Azospirillum sp. HJ39]|uniref:hypothetical protein n=1 Tax=Azospirillum sp. HJ39 TaxID=3159496 RepID=UPI003556D795
MTDAITRSTTATGEQNDPVAQLAQAVRRHIVTDGAEPVCEMREIEVLDSPGSDRRSIAASLYLAQDIAAGRGTRRPAGGVAPRRASSPAPRRQ